MCVSCVCPVFVLLFVFRVSCDFLFIVSIVIVVSIAMNCYVLFRLTFVCVVLCVIVRFCVYCCVRMMSVPFLLIVILRTGRRCWSCHMIVCLLCVFLLLCLLSVHTFMCSCRVNICIRLLSVCITCLVCLLLLLLCCGASSHVSYYSYSCVRVRELYSLVSCCLLFSLVVLLGFVLLPVLALLVLTVLCLFIFMSRVLYFSCVCVFLLRHFIFFSCLPLLFRRIKCCRLIICMCLLCRVRAVCLLCVFMMCRVVYSTSCSYVLLLL